VATKRQVEAKLRELIRRLDGANGDVRGSLSDALPETRTIEVTITDLGDVYWTELESGRMSALKQGARETADIRVRLTSDHLVELVDGEKSLFSSFIGGQIKIEASFGDLMRLRKLA
jgi:hypothetical protein